LAYAVAGEGDCVVQLPFHYNHVARRWNGPIWFRGLAEHFRVVHYDSRGQGLSARGLAGDPTTADYRTDLETILDVVGFERFALMGYGGFGHIAARYAADHPERVTALILICSAESFEAWSQAAYLGTAQENWELFLDLQIAGMAPEIRPRAREGFAVSTSQQEYLQMVRAFIRDPSLSDLLPRLTLPTLLVHSLDQHWLPPAEGAALAAKMRNARILFTDGDLEPTDRQAVPAIIDFLKGQAVPTIGPQPRERTASGERLSARQTEVLWLIAQGKTTREIAEHLVLSDRTVERHIADIYAKIGARNRSEATAFYLSRFGSSNLAESTQPA
jgi:pimeloyl-ACP methyl ester carboxylesterase/DNA-binding CsgD family transcriptional regulator